VLMDPARGIVGIVTLGHQLAYFDILPLYVVLLSLLPVLMWLARLHAVAALSASLALYVAAQMLGLKLPSYPGEGSWFFNPLAWQLLFTIGFTAGVMAQHDMPIRFHRAVFAAACAYLVFALAWVRLRFALEPDALPLPRFLWEPDKQNLSLPRLLHVLALAYVIAHLPLSRRMRDLPPEHPIVLLGRHALPVFCLGSLLSALGQILRFRLGASLAFDIAFIGAGIAAQLALAWVLEWHARSSRPATARAPAGALAQPS
jgi:hypothetical protein